MFDAGWNSTRITVWGVSTLSELSERGIGMSLYDFTTHISDSIHEAIRPLTTKSSKVLKSQVVQSS